MGTFKNSVFADLPRKPTYRTGEYLMKSLHAICALVALFFSSAFCYSLSFYLFDARTNQEIPSGFIGMVGNGLNLSVSYTAGDQDAFNIAGGTYAFTFSSPGYKDSTVSVNLSGARSFSIGLRASSSIRINTRPQVRYDKGLHITGNNSEHGISLASLYTLSGRKVFTINRPRNVAAGHYLMRMQTEADLKMIR
jgi:hypothetical protein